MVTLSIEYSGEIYFSALIIYPISHCVPHIYVPPIWSLMFQILNTFGPTDIIKSRLELIGNSC